MASEPRYPVVDGYKTCTKCLEHKPLEDYYTLPRSERPRPACKTCHAIVNRMKSGQERKTLLERVLEAQGYVCPGCDCDLTLRNSQVDHNHADGSIRGALCRECNLALGFVFDSRDILLSLIDYLEAAEGRGAEYGYYPRNQWRAEPATP